MAKPLTDAERERFLLGVELFVEAAEACGFNVIPVPLEEYRRTVEADRLEDRRLLASGEMTADQLQERNAFIKGPIKILDMSAAYK